MFFTQQELFRGVCGAVGVCLDALLGSVSVWTLTVVCVSYDFSVFTVTQLLYEELSARSGFLLLSFCDLHQDFLKVTQRACVTHEEGHCQCVCVCLPVLLCCVALSGERLSDHHQIPAGDPDVCVRWHDATGLHQHNTTLFNAHKHIGGVVETVVSVSHL